MNPNRSLATIAVLVACLGTYGCEQVLMTSDLYVGAPALAPVDPAEVKMMSEFPAGPYVKLGEIVVEPQSGTPPAPAIEKALQKRAAQMGADAVVIVMDQIAVAGLQYYWDRDFSTGTGTATPFYGHAVKAVAIKTQ